MKIKTFFRLIPTTLLISFGCFGIENREQFYSLPFLRNHHIVRKVLKKAGFQKIIIKTPDNLNLSGLFLSRQNATCNVIVCAGWLPGRKEGMATFYDLLPEYCNILLFDARGHGESEGSLLWKLWRYGVDEYKDIIGATSWIHNQNKLPIFIAGICSGAFNAAHACAYLEHNKLTSHYNIQGLIFDSGWGSVNKIITTAPIAGIKKRLALFLTFLYKTRKSAKNNLIYDSCCSAAEYACTFCNYVCASPLASQYDRLTNLSYKFPKITLPMLFIHSHDDTYANFFDTYELAQLAPHKQCWWIEKSSHAKHHLIHKDLYKEKLIAFIDNILQNQ